MIFENENNATLVGHFEEDQIVKGEYKDSLGNIFRSKEKLPTDLNRISTLIKSKFHNKNSQIYPGQF